MPSDASPGSAPLATVVPSAVGKVRVERLGAQRWLVTEAPPEVVYPEVRAFWQERGFNLTTDNAQAMVLASQAALHYSPEPKVIGKLVQSARLTGNEALAQWHEAQQQTVYGTKAD